eukprot:205918_1
MAQPADEKSESEHLWPPSLLLNKAYALAFACIKCNGIAKTCMNNEDGEVLCDQCAKHDESAVPNKTVQKMINKLKTKCLSIINPNNLAAEMEGNNIINTEPADNQCDWTGMIQEWKQHSILCPYLMVNCTACNKFKCQRKLLAQHTNKCPEVMIDCSLSCGSKILRKNIQTHLDNDCMEQLLDCTNDDCKEQIKRKNFEIHVKNECDTRIVTCEFEKYGCIVKQIKANELKKHINEYKFDHLSNKFDYISNELQKENQSLKTELNDAKASITQLTESVNSQQQTINQLTQKVDAMTAAFEEEKKRAENEVRFDKYDLRYITTELNGKIVKTKGGGCHWNSVYSSTGFNSGIKQWEIKINSIGSDGSSYQHVGLATQIHEGQNC